MDRTEVAGPAGPTRRDPRSLFLVAAILLAARVGAGVWEQRHPADAEPDLVTWVPVDQGEAAAKKTGKPMLLDFSADWCGPCKTMAREVFRNRTSAEFINTNYVPVHAVDQAPGVGALQKKYGIDAFPTLVLVAADGATDRQRGYGGSAGTMTFLERFTAQRRNAPRKR